MFSTKRSDLCSFPSSPAASRPTPKPSAAPPRRRSRQCPWPRPRPHPRGQFGRRLSHIFQKPSSRLRPKKLLFHDQRGRWYSQLRCHFCSDSMRWNLTVSLRVKLKSFLRDRRRPTFLTFSLQLSYGVSTGLHLKTSIGSPLTTAYVLMERRISESATWANLNCPGAEAQG